MTKPTHALVPVEKARQASISAPLEELEVRWSPRGIGRGFSGIDLRTGLEPDGYLYDLSGFVRTKGDGHLVVALFGDRAYLDYRPSEPDWIQVKICADQETLRKIETAVYENDCILTLKIVREALGDPNFASSDVGKVSKERVIDAASFIYEQRAFSSMSPHQVAEWVIRSIGLSIEGDK